MIFEFDISESESLVSIRVEGTGDFQKGIANVLAVANDARFKDGFNVLVDLCRLNYHPSLAELRLSPTCSFRSKISVRARRLSW